MPCHYGNPVLDDDAVDLDDCPLSSVLVCYDWSDIPFRGIFTIASACETIVPHSRCKFSSAAAITTASTIFNGITELLRVSSRILVTPTFPYIIQAIWNAVSP